MMPVLRTLIGQLDGRKRPVRLLGVSVSNFLTKGEALRAKQVIALSLWDNA